MIIKISHNNNNSNQKKVLHHYKTRIKKIQIHPYNILKVSL